MEPYLTQPQLLRGVRDWFAIKKYWMKWRIQHGQVRVQNGQVGVQNGQDEVRHGQIGVQNGQVEVQNGQVGVKVYSFQKSLVFSTRKSFKISQRRIFLSKLPNFSKI